MCTLSGAVIATSPGPSRFGEPLRQRPTIQLCATASLAHYVAPFTSSRWRVRLGRRPKEVDMSFRIAVVQPIANPIEEAEKNVADAVGFIARAKAEGADFVCFPETYPGPWRMPATFDPTPAIAEAAAKHGVTTI